METKTNIRFEWQRAKPLDLSFKALDNLYNWSSENYKDAPSAYRMLGLPVRQINSNRYATASLLLNDNRLSGDEGLSGLRALVNALLVQPDALCWLDLSRNRLTDVTDELFLFPNLRTLYLHDNAVTSVCVAGKLRRLPALRTLTLQNNPVASVHDYRVTVIRLLPRLASLDFVRVTDDERTRLASATVEKALKSNKIYVL
ncbi:leucine-rich repeat-containing protein 51-like [Adelges cooleyi]|uniref:leucine-rich repeat-containing protein 51-like n=1 Tax=Adelges cooleyi TaxID=133065 RepID=UPI00217F4A3D|nr:leucine-rich repeat-containing protein 51-like [Adelges cooleyi]